MLWAQSLESFDCLIKEAWLQEHCGTCTLVPKKNAPDHLTAAPAFAWLDEKGLKEGAKTWEDSVRLPASSDDHFPSPAEGLQCETALGDIRVVSA